MLSSFPLAFHLTIFSRLQHWRAGELAVDSDLFPRTHTFFFFSYASRLACSSKLTSSCSYMGHSVDCSALGLWEVAMIKKERNGSWLMWCKRDVHWNQSTSTVFESRTSRPGCRASWNVHYKCVCVFLRITIRRQFYNSPSPFLKSSARTLLKDALLIMLTTKIFCSSFFFCFVFVCYYHLTPPNNCPLM